MPFKIKDCPRCNKRNLKRTCKKCGLNRGFSGTNEDFYLHLEDDNRSYDLSWTQQKLSVKSIDKSLLQKCKLDTKDPISKIEIIGTILDNQIIKQNCKSITFTFDIPYNVSLEKIKQYLLFL